MVRQRVLAVAAALILAALARGFVGAGAEEAAPRFEVDPAWPRPLPNRWLMGQAAGVAVDRRDHVWVIQRPRTVADGAPAPPVMEFDADGALVQAWGAPPPATPGPTASTGSTWTTAIRSGSPATARGTGRFSSSPATASS